MSRRTDMRDLMAAVIEAGLNIYYDPRDAEARITRLAEAHDGRYRFVGGTHELRLGGVAGTCTAGGVGVLESWLRAARKKIRAERGDMKPIAPAYLAETHHVRPGSRLHRLVSRLMDTHIDDLTDGRIEAIERAIDEYRLTHASGARYSGKAAT